MEVDLVTLHFSTVVVYSENYDLILSQRKQDPMRDKWQCPGGKFLNENETPLECAKRELFKEIGLITVDNSRYNYEKTIQYGPSAYGQHLNCLRHVYIYFGSK